MGRRIILYGMIVVIVLVGAGTALAVFFPSVLPFSLPFLSSSQVAAATMAPFEHVVEFSGTVRLEQKVDLAFEQGGRVSGVYAEVGATTTAGDVLAEIDNSDIRAGLSEARAGLAAERAALQKLERGTRTEELDVKRHELARAEQNMNDAKDDLWNALWKSYTTADEAVLNQADQFFLNPRTSAPQLNLAVYGEADLGAERFTLGETLIAWNRDLSETSLTQDLSDIIATSKSTLLDVREFLNRLAGVAYRQISDTQKSTLGSARTSVDTAYTALLNAESSYNNAKDTYDVISRELNLLMAGARAEDISRQRAVVGKLSATIDLQDALLKKTQIVSPFDGVVARNDLDVGETVAAREPVITVVSDSAYEIEANVTELDIIYLSKGDRATVTFDAYGKGKTFEAVITSIDFSETVIDHTPTYGVTLRLDTNGERVFPGMTANISVAVENYTAVAVPSSSIVRIKNRDVVYVKENGRRAVRTVITGIRRGAYTEIANGLFAGEEVFTNP